MEEKINLDVQFYVLHTNIMKLQHYEAFYPPPPIILRSLYITQLHYITKANYTANMEKSFSY